MYVLIILLLLNAPGQESEIKYRVQATPDAATCEITKQMALATMPKELADIAKSVKAMCIDMNVKSSKGA